MNLSRLTTTLLMMTSVAVLSACQSNPFKKEGGEARQESSQAAEPAKSATPEWMNANGEVIDASKAESGHGTMVKGLNDWEGEITGKPAKGSKFTKLKIGMSMKQATDLIGQPSDQGAYVTGKAWIPFYFGSDRHRYEMVYKGQGRLIFAGGGMGDFTSGHLIWIIHSANQGAYR